MSFSQKWLEGATEVAKGAALELDPAKDRRPVRNLRRDVKILGDERLHEFIRTQLQTVASFPVLSEEGEHDVSREDFYWIIDPIDGSLNYSRGIPFSCISIALWKKMEPVLGVVFDFHRDELFRGMVGGGAFLNNHPLKIEGRRTKEDSVLLTGFPVASDFSRKTLGNFIEEIRAYKKVRLLGSAALSLAYVAVGRADLYQENGIALWDVAAGLALVKTAGGIINCLPSEDPHRFYVQAGNKYLF